MTTELLAEPDRVLEQALTWPDRARAVRIVDLESYRIASGMLLGIKDLRHEVDEGYDKIIRKAFEAHREAVATKKKYEAPLLEAERVIKDAIVAFDAEQERARVALERQLQEQARELEEARQLEEAAALETEALATGDTALLEEARELASAPVAAPAVFVPRATPTVAGISLRETWSAHVTDFQKLVAFVAANPSYLNLLQVNTTALNQQARSLKASLRIPGVQAMATKDVAAGRR